MSAEKYKLPNIHERDTVDCETWEKKKSLFENCCSRTAIKMRATGKRRYTNERHYSIRGITTPAMFLYFKNLSSSITTQYESHRGNTEFGERAFFFEFANFKENSSKNTYARVVSFVCFYDVKRNERVSNSEFRN